MEKFAISVFIFSVLLTAWNLFAPWSSVAYKVSYVASINDQTVIAEGVFEAFGTDDSIKVKGEAIPMQASENQFLIFSLFGGKPMEVPGYGGGNSSEHSITQYKLLHTTFSGDYGGKEVHIGNMLDNLRASKPFKCISPTVLPEMYFAVGTQRKSQLKIVERDNIANYGVKIRNICITITDEPYTNGRLAKLFPWIKKLDMKDTSEKYFMYRLISR